MELSDIDVTKHLIWRNPAGGRDTYSVEDSFVHHLTRCLCENGNCEVEHLDTDTVEVSDAQLFFLVLAYGNAHP